MLYSQAECCRHRPATRSSRGSGGSSNDDNSPLRTCVQRHAALRGHSTYPIRCTIVAHARMQVLKNPNCAILAQACMLSACVPYFCGCGTGSYASAQVPYLYISCELPSAQCRACHATQCHMPYALMLMALIGEPILSTSHAFIVPSRTRFRQRDGRCHPCSMQVVKVVEGTRGNPRHVPGCHVRRSPEAEATLGGRLLPPSAQSLQLLPAPPQCGPPAQHPAPPPSVSASAPSMTPA